MIDGLENYCFRLSRSQGMSDLREIISNYDTMLTLTIVAPSIQTSVATRRVIRMPQDDVL